MRTQKQLVNPFHTTKFYAKDRNGNFLKKEAGQIRVFNRYTDACEALDISECHNDQPFIAENGETLKGVEYRIVRHRA